MTLAKTIAIVGSNGFIGKHLCQYFLGRSYKIRRFDSRFPFDLTKSQVLRDLEGIDIIIWAASRVNPMIAEKSPEITLDEYQSWVDTLALLKLAKWDGKLIFLSSGGSVYDSGITPYKETDGASGSNAYGKLKSKMESELQVSGLHYIVLRVANVYGPFQKLGRGQGVLAEWLNCFKNNAPLLVFGSENSYRDYINVLDVCRGIESVFNIDFSDTFNLGSGVATSLGDLLKIFKDCAGKEIEVIEHASREYDRHGFFLDLRKFQMHTNWEPTVDLATGISRLLKTEKESNGLGA